MIAPTFQADMRLGQRGDGLTRPVKIALDSIGTEKDCFETAAIAVAGFVLARIPNIEDTDRADEVELRSTDVDVGSVLDQM